ncbi:MAG: TVP38/TMEM64 family protein [Lachnospiraceae bacterium]|nr:TVP38/TMEM64 family protein [Lachnospiraceae bacterium]
MKDRKKICGMFAIAIFVLFSAAVFWFVGRPMLAFVSEPEKFRLWVENHGVRGRIAFVGMMVLQIVIAVIPGEPLEIGAGYAFGIWEGTALCLIGIVIGSAAIFLFVRAFGVKVVEIFFPEEKIRSVRFLQDTQKLNVLTFFIFLIPGTPKDLLSYVVGLTKMNFLTWLFISGVARIPSVITSTIGGDALGMQNYQFAVLVFAVTLAISLGGILLYHRICRTQNQKKDGRP